MLLQVDGSKHDWLEGRGPWLTLRATIDDATNEVPWALFRAEEDATDYMLLLHHISQTHGLPLALYADRHSIFQSPKEATITEQLAGLEPKFHLGRMFERVDIQLIATRSPQTKRLDRRIIPRSKSFKCSLHNASLAILGDHGGLAFTAR